MSLENDTNLDCEQSLSCSKICKRQYLSSEVGRVARVGVVRPEYERKERLQWFHTTFWTPGTLVTDHWPVRMTLICHQQLINITCRPVMQGAENVFYCHRPNIFVLGEIKTTASLLYLQNLKRIYSKKQNSKLYKILIKRSACLVQLQSVEI